MKPRARPLSQSITALGPSDSFGPPTVGHPCDWPVPGDWEWTTANPLGTQVATCEFEILGWLSMCSIVGGKGSRGGASPPTSWRRSQKCAKSMPATPE